MTSARINGAIALVLMVLAFSAAWAMRPTLHLADKIGRLDLEQVFPKQFGEWVIDERSAPVQLVSPVLQEVIDRIYNQTLSRTYVNPQGQRIMLSVAYGGDQSDATRAHRPEVCYPAQGFQIVSSSTGAVQVAGRDVRVRRLVAKAGGRIEPITYWVITGNEVSLTGTEQKLTQMRYTLRGVIPDGMLVRVSSIDGNYEPAYALQAKFIDGLTSALPTAYRDRVIGSAPGQGKVLQ